MNSQVRKPFQIVAKRRIGPADERLEQAVINTHRGEGMTTQRRRAMIAEVAYFRAKRRDFAPGHEVEDWLAAEHQIDSALRLCTL